MMSIRDTHGGIGHLYSGHAREFQDIRSKIAANLLEEKPLNTGTWQQLNIADSPMHATHELEHVTIWLTGIPLSRDDWETQINPDLPWAEDHFQERVGGQPVNPGTTHDYWPYHGASAALHLKGKIYDHNYMERFWPKYAGEDLPESASLMYDVEQHHGIRFDYGDLDDVVHLLVDEPMTRQAYLPVWFPEDTGAVSKQRVPCTLGYHFMIRKGILSAQYFMRSTEIYRHFTNDVYLAGRLMQWVAEEVNRQSLS